MSNHYYQNRLLFILRGANLQSVADQQFQKMDTFTNYQLMNAVGRLAPGAVTIACAGGIYTGAGKSGNILVAAAQVWTGLTGNGKIVNLLLTALVSTDVQTVAPIFSLTVGSTGAATADIYLYGIPLD